jgi:hypothetical protein
MVWSIFRFAEISKNQIFLNYENAKIVKWVYRCNDLDSCNCINDYCQGVNC